MSPEHELKIFTLGNFKIVRAEQILTDNMQHISKRWRLFQILITSRSRTLSHGEICNYLSLKESFDPQGALKSLVYSLRKSLRGDEDTGLNQQYIINQGGSYAFNKKADYWLDAEQFENLYHKAEVKQIHSSSEAVEIYKKAIELYRGNYLGEAGILGWLVRERSHYRKLYQQAILAANRLFRELGDYEEAWSLCETGLSIIPFSEKFHQCSIITLLESGNTNLARIHHEEAIALFRETGLEVPPDLLEVNTLFLEGRKAEQEQRIETGSLKCKQEIFNNFYKLNKQQGERVGPHLYLVDIFITVESESSSQYLKRAMENLIFILQNNLRKGDIYWVCNESHVLLLLGSDNEDYTNMIIKRIQDIFYTKFRKNKVKLDSSLQLV